MSARVGAVATVRRVRKPAVQSLEFVGFEPDRNAVAHWCLTWRTATMSAPAFWYFATKREAITAQQGILGTQKEKTDAVSA